ncbi:hypothetical protein N0V93_008695 [Gnomoniopsis smithogilvyi]|uniref:Rhodopsin domain-containing protein n=1 Tax=Gnomoniopsis smithogilvyi TaxID=1191159 RepID=A0A9W8YQI4_9PEZI|nr:hypothetical protein N0V93_008695 [Gnomoniopsis smithogilvyi]
MAKLSICCLYLRIFGVKRSYARYIWFLGGLQVVTNLVLIFIQAFQCKPVDAFWKWWVSGKCLSTAKGVAAVEPPNSVIDFFLVVLAVIMVRSLQMSNKNKWNLRFLFGLGSLAGVFGFIKVGVVYTTSDPAKQMVQLGIWAVVQSFASIVCCCAPVYKPLLPANGLWGRLTSMVSQYRLRGSRSGGSGGNDKLDGLYSAEQLNNDSLERFGDTRVSQMESQSQSQSWVRAGASGSSEPLGTTQAALAEDHKHPTYVPNLAVYDDNAYPMNAIHVHRSVEIV